MPVTIGDHAEVSTEGWFNTLSEQADMAAISTRGYWHGLLATITQILALKTGVKSKLKLSAGTK